jgi:hypothetical protein
MWAMSGHLLGDDKVIEWGDQYRESLYMTYCLHI